MKLISSILFAGVWATVAMQPIGATQASDLANFRICVSSASTASTCSLPYYSTPYLISSTIIIDSPYVRSITGSGGVPTLKRDLTGASPYAPFSIIYAASSANNLLIQNLIIDGNRSGSFNCFGALPTGWVDVQLVDAPGTPGVPHSGVNLYNVTFTHSPGSALNLGEWAYVYNSSFQYVRHAGIWAAPNSIVNYSYFYKVGVEAVGTGGPGVLVEYNTLLANHAEFSYGINGSQLTAHAGVSGDKVTFLSNQVDGGGVDCRSGCVSATGCVVPANSLFTTNGIEVWEAGVTLNNNKFNNHLNWGILVGKVNGSALSPPNSLTILNNDPLWTRYWVSNNSRTGIILSNASPGGTPAYGGPFTFDGLKSVNNGEWGFHWDSSAIAPGTTVNWVGNAACLTGNGWGAIAPLPAGVSGPASTSTCPP